MSSTPIVSGNGIVADMLDQYESDPTDLNLYQVVDSVLVRANQGAWFYISDTGKSIYSEKQDIPGGEVTNQHPELLSEILENSFKAGEYADLVINPGKHDFILSDDLLTMIMAGRLTDAEKSHLFLRNGVPPETRCEGAAGWDVSIFEGMNDRKEIGTRIRKALYRVLDAAKKRGIHSLALVSVPNLGERFSVHDSVTSVYAASVKWIRRNSSYGMSIEFCCDAPEYAEFENLIFDTDDDENQEWMANTEELPVEQVARALEAAKAAAAEYSPFEENEAARAENTVPADDDDDYRLDDPGDEWYYDDDLDQPETDFSFRAILEDVLENEPDPEDQPYAWPPAAPADEELSEAEETEPVHAAEQAAPDSPVIVYKPGDPVYGWMTGDAASGFRFFEEYYESVDDYTERTRRRVFAGRKPNESLWTGMRRRVMYRGTLVKFLQNPELAARLEATGTALLVRADDRIRGSRLYEAARREMEEEARILMRVRRELRIRAHSGEESLPWDPDPDRKLMIWDMKLREIARLPGARELILPFACMMVYYQPGKLGSPDAFIERAPVLRTLDAAMKRRKGGPVPEWREMVLALAEGVTYGIL